MCVCVRVPWSVTKLVGSRGNPDSLCLPLEKNKLLGDLLHNTDILVVGLFRRVPLRGPALAVANMPV